MKFPYEDLKTFAAKSCIDIFYYYDELEIKKQPKEIIAAWEIGRDIIVGLNKNENKLQNTR